MKQQDEEQEEEQYRAESLNLLLAFASILLDSFLSYLFRGFQCNEGGPVGEPLEHSCKPALPQNLEASNCVQPDVMEREMRNWNTFLTVRGENEIKSTTRPDKRREDEKR